MATSLPILETIARRDNPLCRLTLDRAQKGINATAWECGILNYPSIKRALEICDSVRTHGQLSPELFSMHPSALDLTLRGIKHFSRDVLCLNSHLKELESKKSWADERVNFVIAALCLIQEIKIGAVFHCDRRISPHDPVFENLQHLLIDQIAKVKRVSKSTRFFTLERPFFYRTSSKVGRKEDEQLASVGFGGRLLFWKEAQRWACIEDFFSPDIVYPLRRAIGDGRCAIFDLVGTTPILFESPTIIVDFNINSEDPNEQMQFLSNFSNFSLREELLARAHIQAAIGFCFGAPSEDPTVANEIECRFEVTPRGHIYPITHNPTTASATFSPEMLLLAQQRSEIALLSVVPEYFNELRSPAGSPLGRTYTFTLPQTEGDKAFVEHQLLEDLAQNPEENAQLIEWIAQKTGLTCTQEEIDIAQAQVGQAPTVVIVELSEEEKGEIGAAAEPNPNVEKIKELSPAVVVQIMINQAQAKLEELPTASARATGPSKEDLKLKKAAKKERAKAFEKEQKASSKKAIGSSARKGAAAGSDSLDLDRQEKEQIAQVLHRGNHLKTKSFRSLVSTILKRKAEQMGATIRENWSGGSHPKIHFSTMDGRSFGVTLAVPHGKDPTDMPLSHQQETLSRILGF